MAQSLASKAKPVASVSDEELVQFYQKAMKSGMSESQIENAARAQGYTAADIAKVRERLDQLKSSNKLGQGSDEEESEEESNSGRIVGGKLDKKKSKSKDSAGKQSNSKDDEEALKIEEKPIEISPNGDTLKTLNIFGKSLFNNENLSFEPDLRIATPSNYVLGPDDQLIIDIFGEVLDNFKVKVSPEGTVKILNLSPIYVNGLSIEAASSKIIGKLRQVYQGLNLPGSGSSAQITLGNVRSIKVTLTGEVAMPGTYTVSSLSTLFNAIYLAGGPNAMGSYRNIKLIRNNKAIKTLDLYDFLLNADQKDNVLLRDQDIVYVPEYEHRVGIYGEVKRPMLFEMAKNETFKHLIKFAGGFTENAYTHSIQVSRNTSRERKILTITQDEVQQFLTQSGDRYFVGKVLERFENRVFATGAVFRPGFYAIEPGLTTVKELIKKSEGLREDALLSRALLKRKKDFWEPEMLAFDLGAVLRGQAPDIALQKEDSLVVYSKKELQELRSININGEVNKPGTFNFYQQMTLGDAILMAKGFKDGASFAKLEVARKILNHGQGEQGSETVEIFEFDIDDKLSLSNEAAQFALKPYDIISVRTAPNFENQRMASIRGLVTYPGSYAIKKNQRISDLIQLAGGLKEDAYINGAKFYRDSTIVGVNIGKILDDTESSENLLLLNGDQLEIPRAIQTVKMTGAIQNPVSLSFTPGNRLWDYISEAGGIRENAIKKGIYLTKLNGKSARTKHFLFFKSYPKVEPGDEIVVPAYPADRKKGLTTGEVMGLVGSLSSVSISIITLINILNR